jgi:16S rRNA (cytosine967-C5)-methyltransferase
VNEFLKNHPHFELLDPKLFLRGDFPMINDMPVGASADNSWWQLWPSMHETDGFFAAIMTKKTALVAEKTPTDEQVADSE